MVHGPGLSCKQGVPPLGTREGIERICGEVLEDTAIEIDESVVGREVEGLTERDFNPNLRTGFQTEVRC